MARKATHLLLALIALSSSILGAIPSQAACSDSTCKVECPMHKKPAIERECCQKKAKQATITEVCKCPKVSSSSVLPDALLKSSFTLEPLPSADWIESSFIESPVQSIPKTPHLFAWNTGPPGISEFQPHSPRAPPHFSI